MIQPALLPMPDAPPEDQPSFDAPTVAPADAPSPRLLDRVRLRIRVKHNSLRTEQAYVDWIKRFIQFNGKRHPLTMGAVEVEAFLSNLPVERQDLLGHADISATMICTHVLDRGGRGVVNRLDRP